MNEAMNALIDYALSNHLIEQSDVYYSANLLLDVLKLDNFERIEQEEVQPIHKILEKFTTYAVTTGMIEDTISNKDLFDTRIMNCVMPRPSEVIHKFNALYKESSSKATDYFYHLSIASNYIRYDRIMENISFEHFYKYGTIQITINMSKPEKDPRDIAAAKKVVASGYPKCLLCKENVGFAGNASRPARNTHRIIPLELNGGSYYMQYSPYVYYNEHCIVLNENHTPMAINHKTLGNLLSFVEQYPHYMLGSNADLPIVGGSILSHDHYQGGRHHFPIEDAKVLETYVLDDYKDVTVELLHWPLSTLRIRSNNKESVWKLADYIVETWRNYSDESLGIYAFDEDGKHNTVTPIARRKDGAYEMDLVLRNNRTSDDYPLGIFHPHPQHHHIKKENIGLIEVMGLAILPSRLKKELQVLKACLLETMEFEDAGIDKHYDWYQYLKMQLQESQDIDLLLQQELTKKFVAVLEDAGVYKMNEEGIEGFKRFVESLA